jgi:CAAX protease family protein
VRSTWDEPAFVAVVLGTIGAALAASYIVAAALHVVDRHYDAVQFGTILGAREMIALVALGLLAERYLSASWSDLGLRNFRWRHVVIGVVVGVLAGFVAGWLANAIDRGQYTDFIGRAAAAGTLPWRIVILVVTAVLSPFVQELVFRGLLLQGLLQRTNVALAIAASAAAFALVHAASGTAAVVNAFILGIVLGALFVRLRTLTAPIAAHIAINAFASLPLLVTIWQRH